MIRTVILVLLIGGLAFYVRSERKRNYPLDTVTTPSGRTFVAGQLSDQCEGETCIHRAAYLTKLRDSAALRDEARALLTWLAPRLKGSRPRQLVGIVAIEPGFMRMSAPKHAVGLTFAELVPGTWSYLGQEDMTPRMAGVLRGR